MKTITRAILVFATLVVSTLPAGAQSANRSTAPAGAPASAVGRFIETADASRCRHHCASLTASAPHTTTTPQSLAEQQARSERCSKRMIRNR